MGIGSVGTSCWVFLFLAGESDPFFERAVRQQKIEAVFEEDR